MARKKTKNTPKHPHGRKLYKPPRGHDAEVCGHCRFVDGNGDAIGNPPGIGCRLARGVRNTTPACDQFEGTGIELKASQTEKIRKKTGAIRMNTAAQRAASCITSGLLTSDLVAGGGLAAGKVWTKAGRPHSGKTTEFFGTIVDAASKGIRVHFYDAEGGVDWDYMQHCLEARGVHMEWSPEDESWTHPLLEPIDFTCGDDFYRYMAYTLLEMPDYEQGPPTVLFLCDSAANLTPELLAKDPGKNPMAAQARMHSEGFLIMRSLLKRKGGALCFTNHLADKPGVVFGSPEYMKGGSALHHHSDTVEWMRGRSSGMPQPIVKSRGRRVERSWRGDGKDYFVYAAHHFKKNRRRGSSTDVTWGRICFKEASDFGTGVDAAYDVFQFLCMTGQAAWEGKERIRLFLHKPTFKNDEIRFPKIRRWYDKTMPWLAFRKMVNESMRDPDAHRLNLYQLCRDQMNTGWAQARYREQTKDKE